MKYQLKTVEDYLKNIPIDRVKPINKFRSIIKENISSDFEEVIIYGMIGFVIPHSIYPEGYHVNPKDPLSFINLSSQKNLISLYHSGINLFPNISLWFKEEYAKRVKTKLDMGKSCIRFKNMEKIPYTLLEELFRKITMEDYINKYNEVKKK